MPNVEVSWNINAPLDEVWRAVNDIEAYPDFMDNVRRVEILSSTPEERMSSWSVLLKGSVLEWTERETVDASRRRIAFRQVDGDLDLFAGAWQLTGGDDGRVVVSLDVEFEIGIPLLADMLNPVAARALRDNSTQMLSEIERRVAT